MKFSITLLSLLATSAVSITAFQIPFPTKPAGGHQSPLTFANDMYLSSVGDDHVIAKHPAYPDHGMRIKSTTGWCDPDVRSYSGYLDTGNGRDLFFYFFESRSSPKDDPVIMWINGGPGCSSSLGLMMELGPCTISDPTHINGTKPNPYSWNENANVFFLEEPLGVGFSYSEHGQSVATTERAAVDVAAFVTIFFETFKEFKGREFIMTGESYGGRYLPVFASAIHDSNAILSKQGKTPINLTKVLIGNGMTDVYSMMEGYFTYQCTTIPGMKGPIGSIGACVAMAKALPYCKEQVETECLARHDPLRCGAALSYCNSVVSDPFWTLGKNPYNINQSCTRDELSDGLCYGKITHDISSYFDLPEVRSFLGVSEHVGNFTSCSREVGEAFGMSLDITDKTWLYVAALLERGVKIMSYVGEYDWICNYHGNEAWVHNLAWTGQDSFVATPLREWSVDGHVAGTVKTSGGLTFATIHQAGHMVPYDKPAEALAMLQRYVADEPL